MNLIPPQLFPMLPWLLQMQSILILVLFLLVSLFKIDRPYRTYIIKIESKIRVYLTILGICQFKPATFFFLVQFCVDGHVDICLQGCRQLSTNHQAYSHQSQLAKQYNKDEVQPSSYHYHHCCSFLLDWCDGTSSSSTFSANQKKIATLQRRTKKPRR